jgi:hypothetical protein
VQRTHFCPSCGSQVTETDRFCRNCGQSLVGDAGTAAATPSGPTPQPAGAPEPSRRRSRRAAWIGVALLVLAVAGGGAAVLFSGVLDNENEGDVVAERRARLKPAFDRTMHDRDRFLQLERSYLATYADADEKIRDYRKADAEFKKESKRIEEEFADEFEACTRDFTTPCPDPVYPDPPDVPSFNKETKRIRAVAADLQELSAGLSSQTARPEVRTLHTQLVSAAEALQEEADHNADVLDEAVQPAEGEDLGSLDQGKLRTLREEEALPAIRQMNRAATRLISDLGLQRDDYDVPGGRDLDPNDHSTAA